MPPSADLPSLARTFKALGDETRLRIVALLSHGELCVCHVEKVLTLPQPTASRQLAVLKHAGLVASRREGTWMHYRLSPGLEGAQRRLLRALVRELANREILRKDVERLIGSMGPEACK